jgi:hypothetical protein
VVSENTADSLFGCLVIERCIEFTGMPRHIWPSVRIRVGVCRRWTKPTEWMSDVIQRKGVYLGLSIVSLLQEST